jgi:hypothetical protein
MAPKETIELTEEMEVKKPLHRRASKWLGIQFIKAGIFIWAAYWTTQYVSIGIAWSEAKFYEVKSDLFERFSLVREVVKSPTEADLTSIIRVVANEYEIDPLVLDVLKEKESGGGSSKYLYRFEPEQFQKRASADSRLGLTDDERRMENSSHGVFQVMGYTARHVCGLHWSTLYNPMTSARCAAKILSRHFEETKGIKAEGARLREVLKRYNGAGPRAEAYADDAMSRLAQRLYRGMVKPKTA